MSKWFTGTVLILSILVTITEVQADQSGSSDGQERKVYLEELIKHSIERELSSYRYWHLLLHYRKNLFGGYTSEADGPGFFLAKNGRRNPQAELEATLEKFFSNELVGTSQQQAQCAYPARYQWLKRELSFDERLLPEQNCERFKKWIGELVPESVTLIFPSAYMNNPSSMFGHTLLRIDQENQTEQTRILAYVINYAAKVTTEKGFVYMFMGVSGGFNGYFSIMPYYLKVQEYSEMENRDIWEYRLNFNQEQIERMLMHAWELGNTYFDYYFFKENCSYHLLSLLEIADPELHLTDHFWGWTIPVDTVRLITEQPGLVVERVYRPARSTQIKKKHGLLSRSEQHQLFKLIKDTEITESDDFKSLPPERQAFVLDTAYDYLRYRSVKDNKNKEIYEKNMQILAVTRSDLRIRSEEVKINPVTGPPETGHRTSRIGMGLGWLEGEPFEEIALRPAYHDLLDGETGYTREAQIEALNFKLRYYNQTDRIRLKSLTLVDILSLSPMDSLFKKISWKARTGFENVKEDECSNCNSFNLNIGLGAAVETHFIHREVWYAFAETDADYGNAYDKSYRMGGGSTIGLLFDVIPRWKMHFFTTYLAFPLGDHSDDFRISFHQRYTIHKDLAARVELNRRDHQDEAVLALQAYF